MLSEAKNLCTVLVFLLSVLISLYAIFFLEV